MSVSCLPNKCCPPEDELSSLAAARAGDSSAFEKLALRYDSQIFRLALRVTHNPDDAEDAVQEARLKAHQHLRSFRGDSRFSTWLIRITLNEARMLVRKRRPEQVALEELLESRESARDSALRDTAPTPAQQYAQNELRDVLNEALGTLTPELRRVFLLRHADGLPTRRTAQALGLSPTAVKSRLLRARSKLRRALARCFPAAKRNGRKCATGVSSAWAALGPV